MMRPEGPGGHGMGDVWEVFWTHARDEQLTAMVLAGKTADEIAAAMSEPSRPVTPGTVVLRAQLLKVRLLPPNAYWTPERDAQLRALWTQTPWLPLKKIREALGSDRSVQAISMHALAIGLEPRRRHKGSALRKARKPVAVAPTPPPPPVVEALKPAAKSRAGEFRVVEGGGKLHTLTASRVKSPAPDFTPCPYYDPLEKADRCGELVDRTPNEHGDKPPQYCKRHRARVAPESRGFLGLGAIAVYGRGHRYG